VDVYYIFWVPECTLGHILAWAILYPRDHCLCLYSMWV